MKKWFLRNYKNYICLVVAIILLACANLFFEYSNFGSDAIFALNQGLALTTNITIGQSSIIIGVIAFIIILIIDRKSIGVGTVLMTLTMGIFYDLIKALNIIPNIGVMEFDNIILEYGLKLLYILLAIGIGGFSVALYIYANRGISPLEGILIKINKVTNVPFWLLKIINDVLFFLVGFIMGATISFGSIIAACLYGPVISWFTKLFNKLNFLGDKETNEKEQNKNKPKKDSSNK